MDDEGAPPGQWAADPTGRHHFRWWDGTQWTGHVYDGEVAPNRPPRAAPEQTAPHDEVPGTVVVPAAAEAGDVGAGDEEPTPGRPGRRAAMHRQSFWTGAAVGGGVVAIVALLAWVTVGGDGDSSATTTTTKESTTTTEATTTTTIAAVTTTTLPPGRPPSQVRVQVNNGSGVSGAASAKATQLQGLGYVIAGTGNAPTQQGTVVQCNPGFESEAAALAVAVGSGATVQPSGATVPATADCVVILGS